MLDLNWWWLSYADEEEGYLGVVILPANDLLQACQLSASLGLSPGGQVQGSVVNWGGESLITLSKTFRVLNRQQAVELSDLIDNKINGIENWNTRRGISVSIDTNPTRE